MRALRLFSVALIALALAGCLRREPQQVTYRADPATGETVRVTSPARLSGWAFLRPASRHAQAAPTYTRSQAASSAPADPRLYSSSPAAAQETYAQAPAVTTQMTAASRSTTEDRGLFSALRKKLRQRPVYAAAPRTTVRYAAAPAASYATVTPVPDPGYTLDAGDKLRVVVFGQDGLTNTYIVGADGSVNMPLIGNVSARGTTTPQLASTITERLKQGYVREPHVSVEIEANRPFFILGEVTTPGQYPYVANMTTETAVAIAGGFSPRADKRKVQLSRTAQGQLIKGDVPLSYPVRPGDTIMVKERWF
jgi:polysaccharide export outer membrane protein